MFAVLSLHSVLARQQAISKRRELTVFLNPNPQENPEYLALRDRTISTIVQSFNSAFQPWQNKKEDVEAIRQNLTHLLQNAASIAIMLYAQPGEFKFNWQPTRKRVALERDHVLATVPEFVKTAGESGEPLSQRLVLVQMATEAI